MLAAQLYAWFGVGAFEYIDPVRIILTQSVWGRAWSAESGAAALSVGAAGLAMRWPRVRVVLSLAITLGIVLTVPATGHAASHGALVAWLHVIHLLGGGLWLGTLAALTIVTWPLWRRESAEAGALRAVLTSFTPVALFGAALVVVSGTLLTLEHVDSLTTLLNSDYGRTLAAKVAVVSVIAVVGWRNWRRLRPQADDARSRDRLRRSALLELGLAFLVVLILTAWLSGLPMPRTGRMHH
jgi:copper transport protein